MFGILFDKGNEVNKKMPILSSKQRVKIVLGGLLILVGFVVFILTVFHLARIIDLSPIFENDQFINFIIILAILTFVVGLLLVRNT